MDTTDVAVIGAGQAGLALSHHLSRHGVEHVLLERGRLGERWRSERWDTMRMLTPNWMNALPGYPHGTDPDGYLRATEFTAYLERYARAFAAPVVTGAGVHAVTSGGDGFDVETSAGRWRAANVVVATGWCDLPAVPAFARRLPPSVEQIAPRDYRNPRSLPPGAVLVVGASATGVQLVAELRLAGREVVLAVGGHSRLPRTYRGMDIFWWLERVGSFDRTVEELPDPAAARAEPSLQVAGRPDGRSVDLAALLDQGVRLVGRAVDAGGGRVTFADDLERTTADADRRMRRVLANVDRHIVDTGLGDEVDPSVHARRVRAPQAPTALDLRAEGITSVVWATGHRRSYPWLRVPVLDEAGEIRHHRGVTPLPGVYVLGQRFQSSRSSNFVHGVGRDAAFVAHHLATRLASTARR